MTATQKIESLLTKASKIALKEVKILAYKIMNRNKNLRRFEMGMGTWFFVDKYGKNIGSFDEFEKLKEIATFISEYDNNLHITGEPMTLKSKRKL